MSARPRGAASVDWARGAAQRRGMSIAPWLLIAAAPPVPSPPAVPLTPAAREAVARMCELPWAMATKPALEDTRACVGYVLDLAYGADRTAESLELDPPTGTSAALRFPAESLRNMARHVHALCPQPQGCVDLDQDPGARRAVEWLEAEAEARFSLFDAGPMASIEPALKVVLAGKPVTVGDEWSVLSLWKLRNAVFARHGRPFDDPDLRRFFYGPQAAPGPGFPLKPAEGRWSDARLTAQDKKNAALLLAAEKKLRKR